MCVAGMCSVSQAVPGKASPKVTRPSSAAGVEKKNMNFEETLVEGQVYRPELSVVTGDTVLGGLGMLRLRPDFADRELDDKGEAIP
jgi:hypothetical protein